MHPYVLIKSAIRISLNLQQSKTRLIHDSGYNNDLYFSLTQCWSALESQMKQYQCIVCGWVYDEALGWPEDGIVAGTKWEDIPDDWTCPDCGVSKADFEMVEL